MLYFAAIWQILRFAALGLAAVLGTDPIPPMARIVLLLWLGSTQLAASAGFLMLGRSPQRYDVYRGLLVLTKVLDLIPGVAVLTLQAAAVFLGRGAALRVFLVHRLGQASAQIDPGLSFYFLLLLIVLLDLLFLLVLLSLIPKQESPKPVAREHLPDLQETQIEE